MKGQQEREGRVAGGVKILEKLKNNLAITHTHMLGREENLFRKMKN